MDNNINVEELLNQYEGRVNFIDGLLQDSELLQKMVYIYAYLIDAVNNGKDISDLLGRTQGQWSLLMSPCCLYAVFANLKNVWITENKKRFKTIAWVCDTNMNPQQIEKTLNKAFSGQLQVTEVSGHSASEVGASIQNIMSAIKAISEEKRKQLEAQQMIQDEPEEAEEPVELEVEENSEEETEDKKLEALKKVWKGKLAPVVNSIMSSYDILYKSGYGLESPAGVLTNLGIVKSTSDGQLVYGGDRVVDMEVFSALSKCLGDTFKYYADKNEEPSINVIKRSNLPVTYANVHLKFMFGHIRYCAGKHSLKRYLTKNNIILPSEKRAGKEGKVNSSEVKVIVYDDIRNWIKETLEDYFYQAYIDSGVTDDITQDNIEIVNSVNTLMSRSLKNVIAVVTWKKGVNTRLRICSDTPIDCQAVVDTLTNTLNIGTASTVEVKQMGEYKQGVLDINIIYNERVFSQDSLFAYQVLDILDAQGIKPSWDNVILGKKDDGTIMTYNFKNKKSPTYALYAASRSGKGVMTLNLLASALADGCKLFYIDGKPDMACTIADIAWKQGLDAMTYNGVAGKGDEMLENRGNCIRKENPFGSAPLIPKDLFISDAEVRKFMLITTYLRGIELLCAAAADRSSKSKQMSGSDWVVAVFDECEQAAVAEGDVRSCLDRAEANRKAAKDKKGKKIDLTKDETYKFIQDYRNWAELVTSNFKTCVSSTFGFANMTVFFVWQSTMFPEKYKTTSAIAKIVAGASGNIVKIVGRGAAVTNGSTSYGTPNSLKQAKVTWYDERFSGEKGGFFAIGGNVNSDGMKVFRPFNVYSDADHKELILENAKAAGLTEDDLKGSQLDDDGRVIPEVGFEGYVNSLLKRFNLNAAQQINAGWAYADNFVREAGLGEGINQFMYNTHTFIAEGRSDKIEMPNVNEGMNPDDIGTEDTEKDEEIHFGNEIVDEVVKKGEDAPSKYAQEMLDKINAQREEKPTKVLPTKRLMENKSDEYLAEYHKKIASKAYASLNSFNLSDRTPNSGNGLKVISILLSNLVYICQRGVADQNFIIKCIKDKLNPSNKGKVAAMLGYFKTVMDGTMPHDYMPHAEDMANLQRIGLGMIESEAKVQEDMGESLVFSDEIFSDNNSKVIDSGFDNFVDNQDFDSIDIPSDMFTNEEVYENVMNRARTGNDPAGNVTYSASTGKTAYTRGDDLRIHMIPRGTSDVVVLSPKTYINAGFSKQDPLYKMRTKIFETEHGTSREFRRRWDLLLDSIIAAFPSPSMVVRVTLLPDIMSANNRSVDTSAVLDNEYGIELEDIIEFRRMFKKLPMIKELLLDDTTFAVLVDQYGSSAQELWQVFNQNRALRRISIIKSGTNNITTVTRETFSKTANELAARAADAKFGSDLEMMMALKNPAFDSKPIGYRNRFWEGTKKHSGQAWQNAIKSMSKDNPSILKTAGWAVTAGVAFGAGSVISGAIKAKHVLFGRRR